jgi:vacuolar-type H+-ATPase subunit E/Vma4
MRRKEIDAEISAVRSAEQEKAEKEASERSEAYIKIESAKVYSQANSAQSALETELRNELTAARSDITDKVFEAVADKIRAFTKTPEYAGFLKKSAARISAYFIGKSTTVSVRSADMQYKDIIISAMGSNCRVAADDTILLGGCKAKGEDSSISIDDTLDSRLNEQKLGFYESSGLSVLAI